MERRLAAIFVADVVGYSRMMGADETGTLTALKTLREELFDPSVAAHRGRIVKLIGDGALVEFSSVVDAVACAVAVQRAIADRDVNSPTDKRLELRIGINLGDVMIEGDDIYGDGVNVAARVQELAAPGGVALSATAHEHAAGKVDVGFVDGGVYELKNIDQPVRVYLWSDADSGRRPDTTGAQGVIPLPDKPSIAVLAFDNMSGDPEQDYFSDGIAEDIITALSRVGWLFVIARNSSFAFKGQRLEARDVGAKLGVRYLLEGSVRKAGERLRITAQLIDAASGSHLWADRYDGTLDDIFDLQDQITERVVSAVEPKLRATEIARVGLKRPESLDAYDFFLRALPHVAALSHADFDHAEAFLTKAVELNPAYAQALGYASLCRAFRPMFGWSASAADDFRQAEELAQRAVRADPDDPIALRSVGLSTVLVTKDYEAGLALLDRSLTIDPNAAQAWGHRGLINSYAGHAASSVADFNRAIRLSPYDSWMVIYAMGKAFSLNMSGRAEEGLRWAKRGLQDNPDFAACYRHVVASHALLGNDEEARAMASKLIEVDPSFTVTRWVTAGPFAHTPGQERVFAALRRAELPE
jgi:TolB-like protein/class 3 adenylate cyclase/Tfp pilus assembly protein PilF